LRRFSSSVRAYLDQKFRVLGRKLGQGVDAASRVRHLPGVMQGDIGIDPHVAARLPIFAAKGVILASKKVVF
jgi:hypothetical protein